jgi:hypothetical protein
LLDKTGNIFGGTIHVTNGSHPVKGVVYEVLKAQNGYVHPRMRLTTFRGGSPEPLIFDTKGDLFGVTAPGLSARRN